MAAILRVTNSLPRVRSEATCTGNGSPAPPDRDPPAAAWLAPSLPKRSWVVRTESNVRKASIKRPDPPCVVCRGSGRIDCHDCNGKGRTNHVQSTILPKGEWPKWLGYEGSVVRRPYPCKLQGGCFHSDPRCRKCGGSGLGCCNRCLGTGEYRDIIGFHFMKKGIDEAQNERRDSLRDLAGSYTLTDLLQYKDQLDSGSER